MATFLIGLLTFGICLQVLGGYLAIVDHYFGR